MLTSVVTISTLVIIAIIKELSWLQHFFFLNCITEIANVDCSETCSVKITSFLVFF